MASSFTTNFGFEEIVTGEQSGTWGTTTNFNFDILDRITSYKAVALSDASTATLTVREASPGEATENLQDGMFRVVKFTGSLAQTCTITIAPNTTTAWFIFENATTDTGSSGPYNLIFTQGAGANITLQNGRNAAVFCDGAGSGAIVANAFKDLQLSTLDAAGDITAANFQPDGDTAASDSAAVGYTSAEGLILTGQGSTNDVTIKNDADADVLTIPTGATGVVLAGALTTGGTTTLGGAIAGADNQIGRVNLIDYGEVTNAIGGTGGGTQDIDLTLGNSISATVDTSTNTFTFSNPTASDEMWSFSLVLTNGGSQTVNWPGSVDWASATAPTLTSSGVDILVFITVDGGTIWHGMVASTDSS